MDIGRELVKYYRSCLRETIRGREKEGHQFYLRLLTLEGDTKSMDVVIDKGITILYHDLIKPNEEIMGKLRELSGTNINHYAVHDTLKSIYTSIFGEESEKDINDITKIKERFVYGLLDKVVNHYLEKGNIHEIEEEVRVAVGAYYLSYLSAVEELKSENPNPMVPLNYLMLAAILTEKKLEEVKAEIEGHI